MSFTSARLTNGLTLWGLARPGAGTVSLALVLPVGGRHDPPRLRGLAHLVEHMLFCGTHRWSETQLRDEIEQRGGVVNGRTTPESTTYFVHLPAAELAFGLRALRQLVFAPAFPPQYLPREKNIIAREAAPEFSAWGRRLRLWLLQFGVLPFPEELARHRLCAGSGLEHPAIGYPETRRRITLAEVRAFHARWYHPARARLLAVGEFDWNGLQALAERTLGRQPPGEAGSPPVTHPRRSARPFRHRCWIPAIHDELKQSLALPLTTNTEAERAAAFLLSQVMREALFDRLRQELGLVYSVQADVAPYSDGGFIWLGAEHHHRQARRVECEINLTLDRLAGGDLADGLLERVRATTMARWVMQLQGNAECAETLSELPELASGQAPVAYSERLATITPDEVRHAARVLLARENRQWLVQRPSLIRSTLAFWGGVLAFSFLAGSLVNLLKAWLR